MSETQVNQKPIKQYKLEELPAEITLDMGLYQVDKAGSSFAILGLGILLLLVGMVVMGVGGWFMAFGPSSIFYNTIEGMSFKQTLQAYPGPIASLGFALAALGQIITGSQRKETAEEWLALQIDKHLAFNVDELSEDQQFYIKELDLGKFEIGINEAT